MAVCFCYASSATAASGPAGPSLATFVYETHLGLAALSWTRTSLGLSLRAVHAPPLVLDHPSVPLSDGEGDILRRGDIGLPHPSLAPLATAASTWRGTSPVRASRARVHPSLPLGSSSPSSLTARWSSPQRDLSDTAYCKTLICVSLHYMVWSLDFSDEYVV
uniref:Uncharacterized protein n=1 Tax=Oryza meridionalis TaxID=40149 RepID=A0A0E0ELM2_9ORYZ